MHYFTKISMVKNSFNHVLNFACTQHFYLYLYNRIPNSACTQNLYYKYCTTKHNGCTLKKESTQEYSLGFLLTHQSSNGGSDNCYSLFFPPMTVQKPEPPLFLILKVIYTSVIKRDFYTVTFEHTDLRLSAYGSLR